MPTTLGPREEFIENNLGLVHACAGRFRGRGVEYDDLYSAGCMGLIKAYDGFDQERGVQFSTYAVPVILGEIKKLFRDGGTVKVSRSTQGAGPAGECCPGANDQAERLRAQCEPAGPGGAGKARAGSPGHAEPVSRRCHSLRWRKKEGGREVDIPVESPEEELADRISLQEVLATLPPQDRQLIFLRFFLRQDPERDRKGTGDHTGAVSRRERKILQNLRGQLLQE